MSKDNITKPEQSFQFTPAMVPAKMHLEASVIRDLQFILGSADDGEPFMDGVIWVGTMPTDDGKVCHGLHVYSSEYPEEGSITLATFDPVSELSPLAQALEEGDLNARLKAKGMYTIDEMMGDMPLDKWRVQSGMTDLKFFGEWLERKAREYLTMKAEYHVGNKDDKDELYEWVLAHYGAFHDVLVNFRAVLSSQRVAEQSAAERDVLSERRRQIEVEGWTTERDDKQDGGQLAHAGAAYAEDAGWQLYEKRFGVNPPYANGERDFGQHHPVMWPWEGNWKPDNPRRELVKAAALLIAEIDRLDRLPASPGESK